MICSENIFSSESHGKLSFLMVMFQENKLTGPAALFAASGERIEFEYQDGVVHGPAKIRVKEFL